MKKRYKNSTLVSGTVPYFFSFINNGYEYEGKRPFMRWVTNNKPTINQYETEIFERFEDVNSYIKTWFEGDDPTYIDKLLQVMVGTPGRILRVYLGETYHSDYVDYVPSTFEENFWSRVLSKIGVPYPNFTNSLKVADSTWLRIILLFYLTYNQIVSMYETFLFDKYTRDPIGGSVLSPSVDFEYKPAFNMGYEWQYCEISCLIEDSNLVPGPGRHWTMRFTGTKNEVYIKNTSIMRRKHISSEYPSQFDIPFKNNLEIECAVHIKVNGYYWTNYQYADPSVAFSYWKKNSYAWTYLDTYYTIKYVERIDEETGETIGEYKMFWENTTTDEQSNQRLQQIITRLAEENRHNTGNDYHATYSPSDIPEEYNIWPDD